jgi:enoyl-CoA hydratase/isomerase-like protein
MIQGYCIGGGLGVALCCDLRFAAANSRFAIPAARLGLGYAYGGIKRFVDVVGASFAKAIFYTARQFSADEAVAMELINRVLSAADLPAAESLHIGWSAHWKLGCEDPQRGQSKGMEVGRHSCPIGPNPILFSSSRLSGFQSYAAGHAKLAIGVDGRGRGYDRLRSVADR